MKTNLNTSRIKLYANPKKLIRIVTRARFSLSEVQLSQLGWVAPFEHCLCLGKLVWSTWELDYTTSFLNLILWDGKSFSIISKNHKVEIHLYLNLCDKKFCRNKVLLLLESKVQKGKYIITVSFFSNRIICFNGRICPHVHVNLPLTLVR